MIWDMGIILSFFLSNPAKKEVAKRRALASALY